MKGLNLVDSSGWVEYFTDGPNAGRFAGPLSDGIILATAQLVGATLWTQDVDFECLAHVRYIPAIPA